MSQTILNNIVEKLCKLLDEEAMKGTRPKTIYDMMNKFIIMKQQKPKAGNCCYFGRGTYVDEEKAFEYFNIAAEKELERLIHNIDRMLI
ncbi:3796_t:CDS:2 [Gigaspora rosea]|nr:3796_t:CDS:2 [Gigaspora rosea]